MVKRSLGPSLLFSFVVVRTTTDDIFSALALAKIINNMY